MAYQDPEERAKVETSSEFIGWHIGRNTVAVSCQAGIPWTTNDDGFGGCCPSPRSGCPLRTDCISNTGYWDNGEQSACGTDRACRTMHVYEDYVPGSWAESSVLAIMCVPTTWSWDTVFTHVAVATTSDSSTTSSQTVTESETTPTSTSASDSQTGTPSPTSDPNEDDEGGGSLAWIAGAVIGPVFLIAALVLGIWWYKRRSAKKSAGGATPPGQDETAPAMAYNNYNNNHPQQPGPWGYPQQGQQVPYGQAHPSPFSQQTTQYQPDAHSSHYYGSPPAQGVAPAQYGGYNYAQPTSELDSGPQVMKPTSELDSGQQVFTEHNKPTELPVQYR